MALRWKRGLSRLFYWKPRYDARIKKILGISIVRYAAHIKDPTNPLTFKEKTEMSNFPTEYIRNFSIIAHVDHGKSTLADRLLEITGTIPQHDNNKQVLDKLQVERERGITVKAQTASLFYKYKGANYLLNLIDTPGHVDFNYEVARSLMACQGVILLVDANQGVQAQTVANFYLAFTANLAIVPVMNKIDLKNAKPEIVSQQMMSLFEFQPESISKISAKLGTGVEEVLQRVIEEVPPPSGKIKQPFKAVVFDTFYDRYRGVIAYIAIIDGSVGVGDEILSTTTKKVYEVKDLGILQAEETPTSHLFAGQVGYVVANMRSIKEIQIGDTFCLRSCIVPALPGFKPAKPMVYAGIFALDQSQTPALRSAIEKLVLNDSSVTVSLESSPALGQGWRLGFLGLLHMEVFSQRLEQEYDAQVIVTAPSVPFRAKITGAKNIKQYGGEEVVINSPLTFPDPNIVTEFLEPMVVGTIITPQIYFGKILGLCLQRRGVQLDLKNLDTDNIIAQFKLPLGEIIVDFFDELKTLSSGYASFDYEECGYEPANLVKLSILLNGQEVEELTVIINALRARSVGQQLCIRLKDTLPPHQFQIAIQAVVGSKVIVRETLKALRKDVTAKLYGGDVTRRMKLLRRQAEGKKRLRMIGNIAIPRDTFIKVLRRS